MKSEIQDLISLDDGGSLSVSYRDLEGIQRALIFTIDNTASETATEQRTYKSASIESYFKVECVNIITGVVLLRKSVP